MNKEKLTREELKNLCLYGNPLRNEKLEILMHWVMEIVKMGRYLRSESKIKNRQPLSRLIIFLGINDSIDSEVDYLATWKDLNEMGEIIADELNVKYVDFDEGKNLDSYVNTTIKPNFKLLAPIFKEEMNGITKLLASLSKRQILEFQKTNKIELLGKRISLSDVILTEEVIENGFLLRKGKTDSVLLCTLLTPKLIEEGIIREFIHDVNTIRKNEKLSIVDKVNIIVNCNDNLKESITKFLDFIKIETLANNIEIIQDDTSTLTKFRIEVCSK